MAESDEEEEEENSEENDVVGQMRQKELERSLDEIYRELQGNHVTRTKSDTKPASGEVPVKLPKKMKKSATTKSPFAHFKEDDIIENWRPATIEGGTVDLQLPKFSSKFSNSS